MEEDLRTSDRVEEVKELIRRHDWKRLTKELANWHDPEVADLMLTLDKPDRVLVYRALPRRKAADIFAHFDAEHQDSLLGELRDEDTRHLLAHLSPDDRTALLEELPAEVTQKLMQLLSPEDLVEARQLLGYPEETVGRLMTPDYISVRRDMTIAEAIEHIRETGRDRETFNIIYVTDEQGHLLDSLRVRRFIMAQPEQRVESIMDNTFISLSAFDDREKAVKMIQRYDVYALPVVESEGILIGIVTVDDVLDVAQEEATEDFHKGAAVAPLDMPYSAAMPTFLYRKRVGWLTALIFVNLISAQILEHYEEYFTAFSILVLFMPLLIASGGNAGAQAATLMVRALATGDLAVNRWGRALAKEILVGFLLAVTTGVLVSLLGIFRADWQIGLVVGLAMFSIVIIANLIGVILPFTLTKLRMDPAVASSPLITSLMDAIGLLIYFGIATSVLTLQ